MPAPEAEFVGLEEGLDENVPLERTLSRALRTAIEAPTPLATAVMRTRKTRTHIIQNVMGRPLHNVRCFRGGTGAAKAWCELLGVRVCGERVFGVGGSS